MPRSINTVTFVERGTQMRGFGLITAILVILLVTSLTWVLHFKIIRKIEGVH